MTWSCGSFRRDQTAAARCDDEISQAVTQNVLLPIDDNNDGRIVLVGWLVGVSQFTPNEH